MFSINPAYDNEEFTALFKEHFVSKSLEKFSQGECRLLKFPFSCSIFGDFINLRESQAEIKNSVDLLDAVESQVRKLPFSRNRNDMYNFDQSIDIANLEIQDGKLAEEHSLLTEFRHFLLSDVLIWLENITGIQLDKRKVDLTSSIYRRTDALLCHDDELEGRRIAFIWYLVPKDWDSKKDGGFLQLFSCQNDGVEMYHPDPQNPPARLNPWKVSESLNPQRNQFAFFEVSAYSFHQVTEILSDKERVSLHGWFHGTSLPRPAEREHPTRIPRISPTHIEEELVYRWMNPLYIDMRQQAKIRRRFVRASEIQLINFLKTDQWAELTKTLSALENDRIWSTVGPFNRKNYQAVNRDSFAGKDDLLPDILRQLYRLFTSEAMLVILSDLTGVRFHPESRMLDMKSPTVEESSIPAAKRARTAEDVPTNISTSSSVSSQCASLNEPQLRRWSPGCYTLLADTELIGGNWRVEAVLHLAGYGTPLKRKKSNTASGEAVNSSKEPTSSCWDAAWGGQIVYVAKDEKDDLLTVRPSDNALTLVYVGPDTANFVQYINHLAKPTPIHAAEVNHVAEAGDTKSFAYDLNLTYYEPASDVQSEAGADWAAAIEDGGSEDSVDDEEEDDADADDDDEDDDDDADDDDGNHSLIAESDK